MTISHNASGGANDETYPIYRLLEGYGAHNPLRYLKKYELRRYRSLQEALTALRVDIREGDASGEEETRLTELPGRRNALLQKRVDEFPSEERLLPTSFGNALRAFEDYPLEVYGVDSIVVWVRMLAVIPKEYREMVDAAKAQTDFWMNLWLLAGILAMEYVVIACYSAKLSMVWAPFAIVALARIASSNARTAVIHWGDYVKSCFDLFLPELHKTLKLPETTNINAERELWTRFSRLVVYHQTERAFDRTLAAETNSQDRGASVTSQTS